MFKLLRYFSVTSFVSIVVVAAVLGAFYREIAVRSLVTLGEAHNQALTQVLANALWPKLQPYLATADTLPDNQLDAHPARGELSTALVAQLQGLRVAKVKVYDLRGRTVYSTDVTQIGDDESANAGFLAARDGIVTSQLSHRHQFNAYDRVIEDRDLLASYLPVRGTQDGAVAAVFEVYDDVTPLLAHVGQTQWIVVLAVVLALCALYGVLFVVVRHADRVIRRQHRDREVAEEALRQVQGTLERRVKARTMDLARANAELEAEIEERRLADQRVVHMAHHDALTGLPNRTLLADRIGQAIARAHRSGGKLAVLFLDLDRFKNVNDSFGHAVGDLLLTAVAARLTASRRDEDTVARLGGDEFIISIPDVTGTAEAETVAARILADLAKPFTISGHQLHADGSIGIALYPADGETRGNADAQRRHGDVPRQGIGPRQLPVLQRADVGAREPPALDRDEPAARARARRIRDALPAARDPRDRAARRGRSAAALAAAGSAPGVARPSSSRSPKTPDSSSRSANGCCSRPAPRRRRGRRTAPASGSRSICPRGSSARRT